MPNQKRVTIRRLAMGLLAGFLFVLALGIYLQFSSSAKSQPHAAPVTFAEGVAPIIFAQCAGCHQPDGAAPFSLLTYDDVSRRARQIVEVTETGFMPPWLPADGHGKFTGVRRLSSLERQTLKHWVEQGTPLGDPLMIPKAPEFADRWLTSPPDLIIETPSYSLASQRGDVFRNFVLPVPIDGPRWVESIEIRPDNPRVTHHARLGVDSSNESTRRDAEDQEPGYAGMAWGQDPDGQLVIWAPGMVADPGTPGAAWRLHPESTLVLHSHLQPSGKPEPVKFRVGIRFAKEPPVQYPVILRVGTCDIDIPAETHRHVVTDYFTLPIELDLQMIFPHAHSLCREIQVVAEKPDGSLEQLLLIPNFNENWHEAYHYRQPVRLPALSRIHTRFIYDNSNDNIRNRNHPPRRVVYGSNATDEMADVYLQATAVHPDQRSVLMEDYKRYQLRSQVVGYRKSLELYPDDPWSQEGLAASYVFLQEPAKAIPILEKRLKTGPQAVFPVVSLGMAHLANGEPIPAEAQFRQAMIMDDQYGLAYQGLATALAAQKKNEAAEQMFRRAVELIPRGTESRLALADLLLRRGQLDEAKAVCSAALEDSPEMANISIKLAEISAKQQRYEESLKYCGEALRLAPYTHPAKVLLAVFCCGNGDRKRGIQLLQEARAESPDHPVPALILGQLARQDQRYEEARSHFADAVSLPIPQNWPGSHKQRYLVLLHSERLQLAESLQDIGLALDALSQWLLCEPNNLKLQEMLEELKRAAPEISPRNGTR